MSPEECNASQSRKVMDSSQRDKSLFLSFSHFEHAENSTSTRSYTTRLSRFSESSVAGSQDNLPLNQSATQVNASRTGTSTSGPMVAARAWSDPTP
jgi:hypothetical protein